MNTLESVLENYRDTLLDHRSAAAEVILPGEASFVETLNALDTVNIPDALRVFYLFFGEYDDQKLSELDVYEPHFAWGMHLIPLRFVATQYTSCAGCGGDENPDYWPLGFVPILNEGSGSYVLVNCIASSPTYGGVYDMSEGVGCNLVSNSILEFISASEKELLEGLRVFVRPDFSKISNVNSYLSAASRIFGNTPYFSRAGKMGHQIVDWR